VLPVGAGRRRAANLLLTRVCARALDGGRVGGENVRERCWVGGQRSQLRVRQPRGPDLVTPSGVGEARTADTGVADELAFTGYRFSWERGAVIMADGVVAVANLAWRGGGSFPLME
jgi:hypothetical protein